MSTNALFVAVLAGWLLLGCAAGRSVQQTVTGWFGSTDESERPQARYAGTAGVSLYREPKVSAEVVGALGLYEGVLRYRIEDGFAYVKSEKSGRSGWVRDRDLIERLPVAKKKAITQPPSESAEEPVVQDEPAEPSATPDEPPEKSIFDPY